MKPSSMSCVDSFVFTMLSPSPPCGRVCIFIVMFGFFAWNAFTSAVTGLTVWSPLSTRSDSVTFSLPPPLEALSPSSPPPAAGYDSRDDQKREHASSPQPAEHHLRPPPHAGPPRGVGNSSSNQLLITFQKAVPEP
jgi:hypothetical protein